MSILAAMIIATSIAIMLVGFGASLDTRRRGTTSREVAHERYLAWLRRMEELEIHDRSCPLRHSELISGGRR